jgi:hypothetical protein
VTTLARTKRQLERVVALPVVRKPLWRNTLLKSKLLSSDSY